MAALWKHQRAYIKGRITHFTNLVMDSPLTTFQLKAILNHLPEFSSKFDVLQSKIEEHENGEVQGDERDIFDNNYCHLESQILTKIGTLPDNKPENLPVKVKCRLPEICLPKFDGIYSSWLTFRDEFLSLVHNNDSIDDVDRFRYLVSAVREGTAYSIIEFLQRTNANYAVAWQRLIDSYDNEALIKKKYMRDIYNIEHVIENSATSLQVFVDTFLKCFNALKALGVDVSTWDLFIVHHLSQKLDLQTRTEIEKESPVDNILTVDNFIKILTKRCRFINVIAETNTSIIRAKSNRQTKPNKTLVATSLKCSGCFQSDHAIYKCEKFLAFSPEQRFDLVKKRKLCLNCLSINHIWQKCESKYNCSKCGKRHHVLLHRMTTQSNADSANNIVPSPSEQSNGPTATTTTTAVATQKSPSSDCLSIFNDSDMDTSLATTQQNAVPERKSKQILIATAVIWVCDNAGFRLPCRVVLDSASHAHFVTEAFCNKLNVHRRKSAVSIAGIGETNANPRQMVTLSVMSRYSEYNVELDFLVLPKITGKLPIRSFNFDKSQLPAKFELADPFFNVHDKVDMLIGTEVYHEIVLGERLDLQNGLPPFQKTEFGYVLAGKIEEITANAAGCSLISTLDDINTSIQQFWAIETINSPSNLSIEERKCEEHYAMNVSRDESGRYSVGLPLKESLNELGRSKSSARQQFFRLEQRLLKNPDLRQKYTQFMREYEELQHMEAVKESYCNSDILQSEFYFPHHGVYKNSDATNKLRVVFNGSFKTSTNISLNDVLMIGPTIQDDVFSILARFRKHKYAFSADIVKMYRQVRVRKIDQDLQRIWWRYTADEAVQVYKLKTVTYGTASAPFLAIRTLKQLALDEEKVFPNASRVLQKDFYVDDVATGADTIEASLSLRNELTRLLKAGCFELSKFYSNYSSETEFIKSGVDVNITTLILGIKWDTSADVFMINFGKLSEVSIFTKRVVLSEITQIFDPLGLCAPVVFYAKHFMQRLWSEPELYWDDILPASLRGIWADFRYQLVQFNNIRIPRCVISLVASRFILHGFGDASEKGYGCCIYISSCSSNGTIETRLLCAKSRVAPLRKLTIPRLELCASLLLSELITKVVLCMEMKFDATYLWTDSEITLYRIKSSPSRYATFVGNRVAQIQELTHPDNWFYVPTKLNPADIVSRGVMPNEMPNLSMWWNGPQFVSDINMPWPAQPAKAADREDNEYRKSVVVLLQCDQTDATISNFIFERYSNLTTLLRTVALCFRFIENCKSKRISASKTTNPLTPIEIETALLSLIKVVQRDSFRDEIRQLKSEKQIPKSSKLLKLSPFLDENDLIRVGGRIHHSSLSYDQKHQILLPSAHAFTELVVNHEHFRNLHAGPQALLNIIRSKFWIINGRNMCRKMVHRCVRCFRTRPITFKQVMGQLPLERVSPSRPFLTVGIDFCGPFYVSYKIRSRVTSKVYIAVFVCFCTKACHMELVHDLTTSGFLAALRRFTGRRGNPSAIFSDNATNFVGAQSELKNMLRVFDNQLKNHELTKFCTSHGIHWRTIPPRSPHFGGLWEAAVKSAKYHLKRVIGTQPFTADELQTIIVQIEACMNSRPITPLSTDANDLNALTPGHFLIGDLLTAPPDPNLMDLNFDRLSRWQRVQQTSQRFWCKWSKDYINELQYRERWHTQSKITVGTMVILKDDNLPPLKWILGRIIKLYPGSDEAVRVVDIRTSSAIFKRAVTRVCVLPFEKNGHE